MIDINAFLDSAASVYVVPFLMLGALLLLSVVGYLSLRREDRARAREFDMTRHPAGGRYQR